MNIFQQIIENKIDFVYENEYAVVIKDKFPQAKFHNLVLCKGNYAHLKEFLEKANNKEKLCFFEAIQSQLNHVSHAKVLFNIGAESGQEIFHLHAHIISD